MNISKPEKKAYDFLSINFHDLQKFLLFCHLHVTFRIGAQIVCVQNQTFLKFFYCIWMWKIVHQLYFISFVDALLSAALHPSFYFMLALACLIFCLSRKIPNKVPSDRSKPTKIYPLKHNKILFCM